MNLLNESASAYLRSAMHQPVHWQEWGPRAFAKAKELDKPILLDIGAVWCHWCHVMDRESYEDPELAKVINEHYVAVKVDRDERPDVDSRYQAAVSSMSGQGGWPLTAILTPEGKPFFGGTYFPREERYGRPGMEQILLTLAEVWKTRRAEVDESAESAIAAIDYNESFSGRAGELNHALVDKMVESTLALFDPVHGGFGSQPKFPHPSTLDLLLDHALRKGDAGAEKAAMFTLERMARGGVYDQLGGGFHRYSVDESWVVPHFEKMLYDNSELLKNYVHAYQSFSDPGAASVAADMIRWMDGTLSDREHGGFYASQDADISLDDDGDYFTWTRAEAAEVLTPEELKAAGLYWDIGDLGDMHHNPQKNVLHVKYTMEEAAGSLGMTPADLGAVLGSAKAKLLSAREKRPTPFVDRTVYTGWNALAVTAYLEAAQVLHLTEPREFALLTLDRLLAEGWDETQGLSHVIAYASSEQASRDRVPGMLDDYAFLANACVDGWQATGNVKYYNSAMMLAHRMIADFGDTAEGGFFDTARDNREPLGALAARRKPLQDSPTPAGNPAAASVLLRLEALSGEPAFRAKAEETLRTFAGVVEHFGVYVGTYALALQRFLAGSTQAVVFGADEKARELKRTALKPFAVEKSVLVFVGKSGLDDLPPTLQETLPHLPQLNQSVSFAVVCRGTSCLPPTDSVEEFGRQIEKSR